MRDMRDICYHAFFVFLPFYYKLARKFVTFVFYNESTLKKEKQKMKKVTRILTGVLCAAVMGTSACALAACGSKTTIEISGSTSVNEIMTKLAGEYEKEHNARININANGSGAGIEDAINGRNEIGMSSRALKDSETTQGVEGKQLCIDGIVLAVSKDCPVEKATNKQIYDLYVNGTAVTEGENSVSAAMGRDASSGTREAFDEKISDDEGVSIKSGKKQYNSIVSQLSGTGLVIDSIKNDANRKTVGYISMGSYLANTSDLKALDFQGYGQTDYVEATVDNIKNGSYLLQRPFVIVTKKDGKLSAAAKEFYDWLWSEEAQAIVTDSGYVVKS